LKKHRRFTDEMIDCVNGIDIVSYAVAQGYAIEKSGNDYKIPGLGGMIIKSDRKTWWHGLSEKGGGPIQFVMFMKNIVWADAVMELLKGSTQQPQPRTVPSKPPKPAELVLPEKAADYRRLFAYLCKTRCIDQKIVQWFVHKRTLYQDTRGNCVFVTYEGGNPVFASLRSTLTNGEFCGDVAGSRKIGWGCGLKTNDTLCVFESPIDLMSYMTLQKQQGKNGFNFISVGGVSASPLIRCLDKNPSIRRVVICTDNDETGECFFTGNKPMLEKDGLTVFRERPYGKDWNEDLIKKG
jgi:hypothetical protein